MWVANLPILRTLSGKVASMIPGVLYRRAMSATLLAIMLVLPDRQAIGGDKLLKKIELSGDYTIPIVIKGKTARLKVAADALKWPILNGSFASALALKAGLFKGKGKTDEGDQFTVNSKVVRNQYGASKKKQRAIAEESTG